MSYRFPKLAIRDLPVLLALVTIGVVVTGMYGIVHNQITYTISAEYFTKFKFPQFDWARWSSNDRFRAASIGFLATWWMGGIAAWFLCRDVMRNHQRDAVVGRSIKSFSTVLGFTFLFGFFGYAYGLLLPADTELSRWQSVFDYYGIQHHRNFVRVAYIHNAGYTGAAIGVIATLFLKRLPRRRAPACPSSRPLEIGPAQPSKSQPRTPA